MSGNGTYENPGNGRLWERSQLYDINDRLENIYVHLRDVVKDYGSEPIDYAPTINAIKETLSNHLLRVESVASDWEKKLNHTTMENNKLRDEIKKLKLKENNYKQSKIFQEGIDEYIQKRTKDLSLTLEKAQKQRDNAYKQLEQEKRNHNQSKSLNEGYKTKNETLIKSIDAMRKCHKYNVCNIDNDVIEQRDKLQHRFNELSIKYQRKTFKLDNEFGSKLEKIYDSINSTEPFDAEQTRLLWKQDLNELNNVYNERLKERENQWKESRNQSIKTLDEEFKCLEGGMEEKIKVLTKQNGELKNNIKINEKDLKDKEQELKDKNNKIQEINDKMNGLKRDCNALKKELSLKSNELILKVQEKNDLQTQLSQYKILWQHFFGLDAPLKDQIKDCQKKLSKIEKRHNIESPIPIIPKKKRKVTVNSIIEWNTNYQHPPLMIDNIHPKDKWERFQLYNYSTDSLKFEGFYLENQDGIKCKLSNIEIRPNAYIVIALKEIKNRSDIKVPGNFIFKFTENETLYLCDSVGGKEQIFPTRKDIYTSLNEWNESPLKATPFGNKDTIIRGFIIQNVTGRNITLINHCFTNKYSTFKAKIPNKVMSISDKFRLITVRNDNWSASGIKETDIKVENKAICDKNVDDALLLIDQNEKQFELFQLNQYDDDQNHNNNHNRNNNNNIASCFVM